MKNQSSNTSSVPKFQAQGPPSATATVASQFTRAPPTTPSEEEAGGPFDPSLAASRPNKVARGSPRGVRRMAIEEISQLLTLRPHVSVGAR